MLHVTLLACRVWSWGLISGKFLDLELYEDFVRNFASVTQTIMKYIVHY
jgi:hypothetical protein